MNGTSVVRFPSRRLAEGIVTHISRTAVDVKLAAWQHAVLGHRRLAIFDLSEAGRQPMQSADGQVGITFNGAIYNFKDRRSQLLDLGFGFHSQTDTEVLLNGYLAWGIEALVERLHGSDAAAAAEEFSLGSVGAGTGARTGRLNGGIGSTSALVPGTGFRVGADAACGTGLAGVERRLATFDGILAVSSPPGGPTIVVIEVPCASSSAKTSSC